MKAIWKPFNPAKPTLGDRPPVDDAEVLVYGIWRYGEPFMIVALYDARRRGFKTGTGHFDIDGDVTHWTNLPEPPK